MHQFALSARELRENEYPPECAAEAAAEAAREAAAAGAAADDDDDDADEAAAAASGPAARLLGLDCEMCYAGDELQLARVAIVDETMTPLLDELVVPEAAVTDHNTAYSGITPAMLATATLTRAEVVAKVRALIDGDGDGAAYLVGHSLENDLRALGMAHGRVLDTALLYPLRLNVLRPPAKASLRSLASRYLGRQIQTSAAGHDPTEDAAAAMELALLKLRRGLSFGVPGASYGDGFDSLHAVVGAAGWAAHAYDRQAELQLLHAAEEVEGGGARRPPSCACRAPRTRRRCGARRSGSRRRAATARKRLRGSRSAPSRSTTAATTSRRARRAPCATASSGCSARCRRRPSSCSWAPAARARRAPTAARSRRGLCRWRCRESVALYSFTHPTSTPSLALHSRGVGGIGGSGEGGGSGAERARRRRVPLTVRRNRSSQQ